MSTPTPETPFAVERELCKSLQLREGRILAVPPAINQLPGQPLVGLDDDAVLGFLGADFATPTLDRMSKHLWLLATPKHSHISALHAQIVRGRQIVISEDAEMHLVWIHTRVFVKPLPPFLLSHAFWSYYFGQTDDAEDSETKARLSGAALGYLRTWAYLVRHESDYRIAIDNHLIPEDVSYAGLVSLLADVQQRVADDRVSGRYRFGELRLSRLNYWVRLLFFRRQFRKVAWQYSDYFAMYYAPLLFLFGVLSLILSAMQLGVGASPDGWGVFKAASAWFSVATLCLVSLILMYIAVDFVSMSGREVIYAFRRRLKREGTDNIV